MSKAYEAAGVDLKRGYEVVDRIKKHIARTARPEVASDVGGFGGLFSLEHTDVKNPVLVSGTDGVGTKILLAQQSGKLDTIGIDCVAMCVNDVLAQGAEPLLFLDYLAVGKNTPEDIEQIVAGIAEGCVQSGCALIGGETAEMPDLYDDQEFDLAGFTVGLGDREKLIDGTQVAAGDVLIGLPSSGIHSNGYSLVRKLFFKDEQWAFDDELPSGKKLIDELLEPTKIYVKDVLPLVREDLVRGVAHITGGGFIENLPRMMGEELQSVVDTDTWDVPEVFDVMSEIGEIEAAEMFNVFNMGIGMVLAVRAEDAERVLEQLPEAIRIGEVRTLEEGAEPVVLEGEAFA